MSHLTDCQHLEGIPYKAGDTDCYGLFRRYYREKFALNLTNYARPLFFWKSGLDLFNCYFRAEGFRPLLPSENLSVGDGILMAVLSTHPNHIGVYLGRNRMLHHFHDRPSEVTDYSSKWRHRTFVTIRHPQAFAMTRQDMTKLDILQLDNPIMRDPNVRSAVERLLEQRRRAGGGDPS